MRPKYPTEINKKENYGTAQKKKGGESDAAYSAALV